MNLLCDRLLLGAMLEEAHAITGDFVDAVAREMAAEGARPMLNLEPMARGPDFAPTRLGDIDGVAALERRLARIETLVQAHDKTIRRAIDLVATYLGDGDTLAMEARLSESAGKPAK